MKNSRRLWVTEETYRGYRISHEIKRVIVSKRTRWQHIKLVETINYGKMLIIDGLIQSSERDEMNYHEAIVHPAMITHKDPSRVLILGGGEGACLREVLKYRSVKHAVMVDIDADMVDISKSYLASMHENAYSDPRASVVIDDALKYVKGISNSSKERFDVIIQDLTDPQEGSPSRMLYTLEYFKHVYNALTDDGLFVLQATLLNPYPTTYAIIYNTLKHVFPIVRAYATYVPCYANLSGLILCSKLHDPLELDDEDIEDRIKERIVDKLHTYDSIAHRSYFSMIPKHVRDTIERTNVISTDDNPTKFPIYGQ